MLIQNQYRAIMQYSFTKGKIVTDWYCVKVSDGRVLSLLQIN